MKPANTSKPSVGLASRFARIAERLAVITRLSRLASRCHYKECRKDFTVTTGTVMERSHIKLISGCWLHLMAASKKGFSAHQLHRSLG